MRRRGRRGGWAGYYNGSTSTRDGRKEREVRVEFSSYLQLPRERRGGKEEGAGHVSASKCSVSTEERALIVHVQDQDQVYSEHSAGAIGADRP